MRYDAVPIEGFWRETWDRCGCHRANRAAGADRFFVHDSTPFPNGDLHMGHVRTYVPGDVTARYARLMGKNVCYFTSFDSFGLPIELEAIRNGIPPRALVDRSIERMTRQLKRLGISYDWTLVGDSASPEFYRWTQWLFLEMLEAGLVERRSVPLRWCDGCGTALSSMQIDGGACWRCERQVEERRFPQWFVRVSRYADPLYDGLDRLDGWSGRVKSMLRGLMRDGGDGRPGARALDWLVSRQRSWGTPIPIVHCKRCGAVPVPREELPVVLPDDVDWGSGPGALGRHAPFRATRCPTCGAAARRESDTLDCFFDDLWCFMQVAVMRGERPGFTRENLMSWLPVDRCQSGLDTFQYFHLYRFLAAFLHERGILDDPEPIRSFGGTGLVLSEGKKMSKHLGNTVSPESVLDEHGADVLRVAMLWGAGPQRSLEWRRELLDRADELVRGTLGLVADLGATAPAHPAAAVGRSRAARTLLRQTGSAIDEVARFVEEGRPNAAVEALSALRRRIKRFASPRLGRDAAAAGVVSLAVEDFLVALSPFAPHLAEECRRRLGRSVPLCGCSWPGRVAAGAKELAR
ncbi:MAG: class I tRNA ligase family protein [bacterium]|nr:class I tRNA ligase family protein [bacterium]